MEQENKARNREIARNEARGKPGGISASAAGRSRPRWLSPVPRWLWYWWTTD